MFLILVVCKEQQSKYKNKYYFLSNWNFTTTILQNKIFYNFCQNTQNLPCNNTSSMVGIDTLGGCHNLAGFAENTNIWSMLSKY